MRAIRILGLAVAVAVVVLHLSMPHTSAHPIAGAHYSGDVVGAGDIDFDVSAAGDQVLNLRVTHIPCGPYWHDPFPWPDSEHIMIDGDHFEGTLLPTATKVTGDFLTDGSANGTFLLDLGVCQSPTLSWTATTTTTTGTPRPAVGGIAELPQATGSSAPNYIPLAGVAAAALVVLTAGEWHARRGRRPR
jgi:hypothetical protein